MPANIISVITSNIAPGPKGFGDSKLFILKLDGDPSSSGTTADVGTLSIYNGTLYIKTDSGDTDWTEIQNATDAQAAINSSVNSGVESGLLSFATTNLEGSIYVDVTNSAGSFISSNGLFDFTDDITVVSEVAETTGTSAAYGAPYVTISSNQFNECRLLAANNDLNIFPNALPVYSSTIQIGNDRTSATVGFNVSNNVRAAFTIGIPLIGYDPGLSFGCQGGGVLTNIAIDDNYTNFQNIHHFEIRLDSDGSLSYYVYDLGDGTGTTRPTRTLVSSGTVTGSAVPSGSNTLTNIGIIGFSLSGTSAFNFFNQKLLLRNP